MNSDMTDTVGPGKLVCHMRNPSNAYDYIVNSIVYAMILVCGSRVLAYRILPTHGPIHLIDMHGTGTKHIVCHSQKSGIQWSFISEFTCIRKEKGISSCFRVYLVAI